MKTQKPARFIRPVEQLAIMVNTLEKLSTLPRDEIVLNTTMVTEIKNALSASNIDAVITGIVNDYNVTRELRDIPATSENALLYAYAQREHKRLKNATGKEYVTEIVNAAHFGDLQKQKDLPARATRKAEENLASAFNSIYANGAVKINTSSDPSLLMSYIDYSPYRVNYTEYLSVPTLAEMVDRPIAMALKKPFQVKSENEKFKAVLKKVFKKAKVQSVIKDMLFNSTLSPRGSLLVPIKRGDTVTFNVFNDTQFAYGMGASYGGLTAPYNRTRVGDLYCYGAKLKHGVSAFFLCPGFEPLFGVGLNRVPQLRSAAEAWNLYVHILKILLVRAQVIVEKMEGDVQTDTMLSAMRAQLQRLSESMGVSTPIAQARGTQLDILNNNISQGTSDIAGVFRDYVASVTGLSPEYFFGGGNTNYSQAAFQIAATNEHVRSRFQIAMIEPMAYFIVNTFIRNDAEVAACGVAEDDFEIEFESIYDETEQEKADLQAKRTETLIRQFEYKELESAFKQLELLDEDITFKGMDPPVIEGGDGFDNELGGDDHTDSKLVKPLQNAKKIMYRLRYPDGRLYGTGSTTGSYWNTPQEALAAKKKSGIKDLMIYEYDTQLNRFVAEVMID